MRLMERARAAVERRLRRIELALRAVEGVRVERRGDAIEARIARRRWLDDPRLRFLGRGR